MENTIDLSLHVPERIMDDAVLDFNLANLIITIKGEEKWMTGKRNAITLVKCAHVRIVLIALHSQMELNFKQSGDVITIQVMEGKVIFNAMDRSIQLTEGGLMTLHESQVNGFIALEDSVFLLTVVRCK